MGALRYTGWEEGLEGFLVMDLPLMAALTLILGATLCFISVFYFTYFHHTLGQTPGKIMMKIKVVRLDGSGLGYCRALLRSFGYVLSGLFFLTGFFWIVADRSKQGWHDKIANTYVWRIGGPGFRHQDNS